MNSFFNFDHPFISLSKTEFMKIIISLVTILVVWMMISCTRGMDRKLDQNNDLLVTENIFPFQSLHCHGSSIAELPNRDLLAVWFYGSGERTADDVAIMGSRRNNKTGKWCEPFLMADVPGFPDINPVIFTDDYEQLWLVWYTVLAYQWETSILKLRISDNYMQDTDPPDWKWQEMIHVKPDGSTPDGIGKNDSFLLNLKQKYNEYHNYLISSGSIRTDGSGTISEEMWSNALTRYLDIAAGKNLTAVGMDINENGEMTRTQVGYPLMRRIGWQTRNKPLFIGNRMLLPLYSDGFDFSMIAITTDRGKTWEFSEPIVGAGPVQPALALCNDSSIVALMRDNGPPPKRLMKSTSKDYGKTWSTVEDTDIPNPGSAADLIVLKSGSWVLVHNDTEEGRHRLSVWLSKDEGKTWPFRKTIADAEPGSQFRAHYPAIIQGKDGMIHVSFTNQIPDSSGTGSVKNISHASFTEKWLERP
jgi:predicted neuraminidase